MEKCSVRILFLVCFLVIITGFVVIAFFPEQKTGKAIEPTLQKVTTPETIPEEPLQTESMTRIAETKTSYFYANGRIAQLDGQEIQYVVTDNLGSTSKVLDKQGNIIDEAEYYAFGQDKIVSEEQYKYTGKEQDDETGLYYYGARYYEPSIGRFIAADAFKGELANPQSLNHYAYVKNNPVRFLDPTGNRAKEGKGAVALIIKPRSDWNQAFAGLNQESSAISYLVKNTDCDSIMVVIEYVGTVAELAEVIKKTAVENGQIDYLDIGGHGKIGSTVLSDSHTSKNYLMKKGLSEDLASELTNTEINANSEEDFSVLSSPEVRGSFADNAVVILSSCNGGTCPGKNKVATGQMMSNAIDKPVFSLNFPGRPPEYDSAQGAFFAYNAITDAISRLAKFRPGVTPQSSEPDPVDVNTEYAPSTVSGSTNLAR